MTDPRKNLDRCWVLINKWGTDGCETRPVSEELAAQMTEGEVWSVYWYAMTDPVLNARISPEGV